MYQIGDLYSSGSNGRAANGPIVTRNGGQWYTQTWNIYLFYIRFIADEIVVKIVQIWSVL